MYGCFLGHLHKSQFALSGVVVILWRFSLSSISFVVLWNSWPGMPVSFPTVIIAMRHTTRKTWQCNDWLHTWSIIAFRFSLDLYGLRRCLCLFTGTCAVEFHCSFFSDCLWDSLCVEQLQPSKNGYFTHTNANSSSAYLFMSDNAVCLSCDGYIWSYYCRIELS